MSAEISWLKQIILTGFFQVTLIGNYQNRDLAVNKVLLWRGKEHTTILMFIKVFINVIHLLDVGFSQRSCETYRLLEYDDMQPRRYSMATVLRTSSPKRLHQATSADLRSLEVRARRHLVPCPSPSNAKTNTRFLSSYSPRLPSPGLWASHRRREYSSLQQDIY